MEQVELSQKEKNLIFWASFLALFAAGIGFGIRALNFDSWIVEFNIDGKTAGNIFGASLWPIAFGMILFSLVVDKVGYKASMLIAFACQILSTIWTCFTNDQSSLIYSFMLAGFGHGIIEACINPLCATMYKKEKSKMLNILHASWPAGVGIGAALVLLLGSSLAWRDMFWFLLIPVGIYGIIFLTNHRYPEDERIENNVSYLEMMKEFGGLSIFIAATFLFYQLCEVAEWSKQGKIEGHSLLMVSLIFGAVLGCISGFLLKSKGKILFFFLCLIMIPLATAEIATDGWIQKLMKPALGAYAGWALVLSSFIMMSLRFFAGVPLKFMSPPVLLFVSSIFSIIGLFMLSSAVGITIFIAFVIYAVGQTFYWPTVLGFTAEQFPKGGAMTLNTVSAMGLLTVGIFGAPFLGAVADSYNSDVALEKQPALMKLTTEEVNETTNEKKVVPKYYTNEEFFGWEYKSVKTEEITTDPSLLTPEGAKVLAKAKLPENPTGDDRKKSIAAKKEFADLKGKSRTDAGNELVNQFHETGRKTLKVAALLPAIMAVAFLMIILYFRSRGGYKPVELDHE